jgi:hypothetical protein
MTTNRPAARRAAVYVRVSSEEQVEGYSLAAQERVAEAFCASHGWEPVVYREEGRSARTDDLAKRPAFARMLADAEAGPSTSWSSTSWTASPATGGSPSRPSSGSARPGSASSSSPSRWTTRARPAS